MQEANRRWKFLRPEVVILFIIPTGTLLVLALLGMMKNRILGHDFWCSLIYMRFFGWQILYVMGFIGLAYLVVSTIPFVIQRRRLKSTSSVESSLASQRLAERFRMAKSFVGLVAAFTYALAANVIAMNALCCPSPARVAWANDLLMRADRLIFGTFVPFEMHEQDIYAGLSSAILFCYLKMTVVFSLVLIALFLFRADRFRQYCLGFVMIMFLCIPGWAAVPATTPSEACRTNKLHLQVPIDIAYETSDPIVHLNYKVTNLLRQLEPYQSNPAEGRYFITSIPSLHVAWGILIVWFGIELYSRSAILLLPWGVLNAIGALYSLQHYAVDAVAGFIVAIIAVYLVRRYRCGGSPARIQGADRLWSLSIPTKRRRRPRARHLATRQGKGRPSERVKADPRA